MSARSDIQTAINAAAAAGGGVVDLGLGRVDIDAPLVTASNVTLAGRGVGATTLRLVDSAGSAIRSSRVIESRWAAAAGVAGSPAGTDWDDRVTIRDLTIDGNGAAQTSPAASVALMNGDNTAAILLDHVTRPTLENVEIIGSRYRGVLILNSSKGSDDAPALRNVRALGTGYTGIGLIWTWNAIVSACRAESCTRAGIYIEGCRYSTVGNCLVENTLTTPGDGAGDGYGFVFDYYNGDGFVTATGNVASVCRSDGFLVSSDGTTYSYILVDGNIATGNSGAGFHLWHAPSAVLGTNISKWNVTDTTLITT